VWTVVVATILGVVFVCSILNQLGLRRWEELVARFDRMMFLPYWGFFAPNPGHTGNHLVYRDGEADSWGDWREVPIPARPSSQWLWNPARFERKALLDLMNGFARTQASYRKAGALQVSLSYLAMLTWVMSQPRTDRAARVRQFAVITTTGHGPARQMRVAILSNEHAFD
jgi:hypothetical protein